MIMGEKRERKVIRIISGGEAAKKYKCLQTEKYNERNSHFILEKATEWQILTHNSCI